jgi:hypothetical protein
LTEATNSSNQSFPRDQSLAEPKKNFDLKSEHVLRSSLNIFAQQRNFFYFFFRKNLLCAPRSFFVAKTFACLFCVHQTTTTTLPTFSFVWPS